MKSLAIVIIANQSNKFVTHSTAILHINCQRKKRCDHKWHTLNQT